MALGQHSGISATEVGRKKRLAEQLLYGKSKPVQHWAEGASELANALVGGLAYRKAEKQESEGKAEGNALLARLLAGGEQGITPPAPSASAPSTPSATAPSALAEALIGKAQSEGYTGAMGAEGAAPQQMSVAEGVRAPGMGDPRVSQAFNAVAAAAPPSADMVTGGLKARGLPEHVAQGFAMNIGDESNFNPAVNEANPTVPGSRGGFGLAQWTGPRRVALEQYAQSQGRDVADPNLQMDFLVQELGGPESDAAKKIMATQTPGDAGVSVARDFLRPAPENLAKRVAEYGGMRAPGNQVAQAGGDMAALPTAQPAQNTIDMARPKIQNPDGTFSTERTIGIEADGRYFNIPTIVNGRQLSPDDAVRAWREGRNPEVGTFASQAEADAAAPQRSNQIGQVRGSRGQDIAALLGNDFIDPSVKQALLTRLLPKERQPVEVNGRLVDPQTGQVIADFSEKAAPTIKTIEQPDGSKVDVQWNGQGWQPVQIPGTQTGPSKAQQRKEAGQSTADVVMTAAQRAAQAAKNPLATGTVGNWMSGLGESDAAEVNRQVDTLKSIAAAENIQAMRQASPTGAALGNASDADINLLKAKAGALDPRSPNFQRDLQDYTRSLFRTIHGKAEGDTLFDQQWQQTQPSGPAVGKIEGGYRFNGGDPSSPDSWEKAQ